ncbi:Endonuclease V [Legionella nautarum]|uniref:Endonuclease V n=1 Tax=Legionella nautarum TaxID=45070 RepID=A0A0W0WP25_9GAMM|nr:deoxyribonuclease V [Legionella nautarum]KTD34097.1 Endonuclease V [Legionella nautarum]
MNLINPPNLVIDNQLNTKQAIHYQKEWAGLIYPQTIKGTIKTIAGLDIAYDLESNQAFAIAVIIDAESLAVLEVKKAMSSVEVPYRSGFLSFRELPALAKAFEQLTIKPDLIVCDGQGIAHPRRFGLACHLGLAYDIPTLGCGKTRLYGTHGQPGQNRGDFSYLHDNKDNIIGCVLRTRARVNPVYISIGHKITLEAACEWILKLTPKYRVPETTRMADRLADEFKMSIKAQSAPNHSAIDCVREEN